MEAGTEGGRTQRAGEGGGGGRKQDGQSLGTAAGPPHFQTEPRGVGEKISSAFETSCLEWPRTFLNPFLCSSPKAP